MELMHYGTVNFLMYVFKTDLGGGNSERRARTSIIQIFRCV